MGITAITFSDKGECYCAESVWNASFGYVKHIILKNKATEVERIKQRHESLQLDNYISIIGEDDFVDSNGFKECLDVVMDKPEVGLVFTDWICSYNKREPQSINRRYLSYMDIPSCQLTTAGLSVINTKYVTEKSLNIALKYNMGIEWAMRTEAALCSSALHVQLPLYLGAEKEETSIENYRKNINAMTQEMRNWCFDRNNIPYK